LKGRGKVESKKNLSQQKKKLMGGGGKERKEEVLNKTKDEFPLLKESNCQS